jgi:hypothetical protein
MVGWAKLSDITTIEASNQFAHQIWVGSGGQIFEIIVGWAKLSDLTKISASNQIAHQTR